MTNVNTWHREQFTISTDEALLDLDTIHTYLYRSYWSPGIPRDIVARAIDHSFCFGLYDDDAGKQIGFARVVTDFATFAYLADVFVLPAYRGQGLGVWLVDCVTRARPLRDIRSFYLATRDAQSLYEKFGFEVLSDPSRIMIARNNMSWYQPELAETLEGESIDE